MDASLSEVHESVDTTQPQKGWKKILSFLGPAYLISVGYMDPGNWATDLEGGSKFGYSLVWVLLMSNLMALLLQGFSARLGIVRRRDLAQANRETYPKPVNFILWLFAEVAIAACDLAEVLGMAIGLQLLTGLPLIAGVLLTVFDTFLLLYLQKAGIRKMEAFIISLVAIVAFSFLIEIILAKPPIIQVVKGLIPSLPNTEALYIAIGIIGATVMPHNLYLHSALVQTRKINHSVEGIKQAIRFNRIDSTIALNIAFLVNAAILVIAATVFKDSGVPVTEIKEAHQLLPGFLGGLAPILFAIALIAAGQSSTITGTLAGQIIMEGYLKLRINPVMRRLITRMIAIIPAFFVILINGEKDVTSLLVLSQVILSMQLAFAVIPLIHFVSDKKTMGLFAIKNVTKAIGWVIAIIIISLNIKWLLQRFWWVFESKNWLPQTLFIFISLFFASLLLYIIIHPLIARSSIKRAIQMHSTTQSIRNLTTPEFKKIAVALDFSSNDDKLIAYALKQGQDTSKYVLLHIVESPTANFHGSDSDDSETREDLDQLNQYVSQLSERGITAVAKLGFRNRVDEIVRIVKETEVDLLVIGAHGHTGLKDFIYGETVNAVRHHLKIPVLVINY
ncbi:MAG: iron/manganese transporter [Sphingobacteriales bacterium]|nr:MAG: iron/manganese transporter [Sphingobacteriales bacterium]